jgi:hypothetical protein
MLKNEGDANAKEWWIIEYWPKHREDLEWAITVTDSEEPYEYDGPVWKLLSFEEAVREARELEIPHKAVRVLKVQEVWRRIG